MVNYKTKITVKNVDLSSWLSENETAVKKSLLEIAKDLLAEFGGAGKPGYDVQEWGERKRPVVNIRAKGEPGWKELFQGGPLTRLAASRKRIQGNPKL